MRTSTANRLMIIFLVMAAGLLAGHPVAVGSDGSGNLQSIQDLMASRQWSKAEAALMDYLWRNPSGIQGASACELLARVSVIVHKAPIAMEWLETVLNNPDVSVERQAEIRDRLRILQRIYLPGQGYRMNRSFEVIGVEMESPRQLGLSRNGQLFVMDRYRLITLSPDDSGRFHAIPPTTPLPEHSRTLKVIEDNPVIITDYGFWKNQKLYGFQGAGEIERVIDAAFTLAGEWLVLDRRNSQMLRFDQNGQHLGAIDSISPSGEERTLTHTYGGCWILSPVSRQILTAGTQPEIKIPYKGPGYSLSDPVAIATDWFGHLYVLNNNSTISIFSPGGSCLHTLNLDPEDNLLKSPSAIVVGSDGRIFVADRKKHEVYCYQ